MKVKVEQFEGPLDLLLQLIENQQLDITSLSLSAVTEQFLEYIKQLETKNPLNLADFLLIASKLLVIKSKSLLPTLDLGMEEEESAFDLTQQLLLYKKYKEAGNFLRRLDLKRRQSWTKESDFADRITFLPDSSITVNVLAAALKTIASQLKEIARLPKKIMTEVVSITEKIQHLQALISEKLETSLHALLKDTKNKTEKIVTFLALLELIKQRVLSVEQSQIFEDIKIKKSADRQ